MCGGKGTRLKILKKNFPKCLVKINGKTLLEYQISLAKKYKFQNITLLTGYKSSNISLFLQSKKIEKIKIIKDKKNLGTGGALLNAYPFLEDEFCLIYCDIFTNINLSKMNIFFKKKKADFCLVVNKNNNFQDSNLVTLKKNKLISNFYLYPHESIPQNSYSNEAIFMCKKKKLLFIKNKFFKKKTDFFKDLIPKLLNKAKIFAYYSKDYIIDCGTPERIKKAKINFKSKFI
jgi:NDP-sugar pyrophosphorylase family protein